MMNKNLLKFGNHKLPDDIAIWVLPEVKTCPGATDYCKLICYALKPVKQYGVHISDSREKNFKISQNVNFALLMNSEIKRITKRRKLRAIRIHEAGDFYNQQYLDKWKLIAFQNPSIRFFTYTRSQLDFRERPENFTVFYSTDHTTIHPPPLGVDNTAEMVLGQLFADLDSKFCWRYELNKGGTCRECNYCYDGKDEVKKVTFFKH